MITLEPFTLQDAADLGKGDRRTHKTQNNKVGKVGEEDEEKYLFDDPEHLVLFMRIKVK
jgi:hypothetical protein